MIIIKGTNRLKRAFIETLMDNHIYPLTDRTINNILLDDFNILKDASFFRETKQECISDTILTLPGDWEKALNSFVNNLTPIGVTKDGVPYYGDDYLWFINSDINYIIETSKASFIDNKFLLFSTKNSAEEYRNTLYKFTTSDDIKIYGDMKTYFISSNINLDNLSTNGFGVNVGGYSGFTYFYYLENAINFIKQRDRVPLFTSEDGVNIFCGDSIYLVNTITLVLLEQNVFFNKISSGFKTFKSKEKAEEYIKFNKKSLSIQDLLNLDKINYPYCSVSCDDDEVIALLGQLKDLVS